MVRLLLVSLFLFGACATTSTRPDAAWSRPSFSGNLLSAASADAAADKGGAPDETTLPIGVGLTAGPSTFLVGGTLDFAIDKNLTFGPSLQYGIDDNVNLIAVSGQLKYFLPSDEAESGSFSLLPYITGGVGLATIDKEGRSSDSGMALNVGAGVRYFTGEHYRIGSEGRLYLMPDKVADERAFLSFELLQIVISF